jgi:hypothetical protein
VLVNVDLGAPAVVVAGWTGDQRAGQDSGNAAIEQMPLADVAVASGWLLMSPGW